MRTFIENYLHFMKNCIRPIYEKLKSLKSGFIENSIFENNRDPWCGYNILIKKWRRPNVKIKIFVFKGCRSGKPAPGTASPWSRENQLAGRLPSGSQGAQPGRQIMYLWLTAKKTDMEIPNWFWCNLGSALPASPLASSGNCRVWSSPLQAPSSC